MLTITANGVGECEYDLNWTAFSTESWLTIDPPSGNLSKPYITVSVDPKALEPGKHNGIIILTALDSINQQPVDITDGVNVKKVGTSQIIEVAFLVEPPCSLGVPSTSCLNFSAEVGVLPAPQSFRIGIDGDCKNLVTITPDTQRNDWLTATASPATIMGNDTSTITVSIVSAQSLPGSKSCSILIRASDGVHNLDDPQTVEVSLNFIAAPALLVSPSSGLAFTNFTGTVKQSLNIINAGGEPLTWNAALDPNTPSGLVTLPINTGMIQGGDHQAIEIIVNATGVTENKTYNTNVTICATDSSVVGSPAKVPITINVTPQNQFLGVMKQFYPPDKHTGQDQLVVLQTEGLFKRRHLKMSDSQLDQLTNSWTPVVTFIADPSTDKKISRVLNIDNSTLTDLIKMNSLLDQLYDRIETVERTDVDIFSIE